jgi:DNA-binding FadR family transcriptional regulator
MIADASPNLLARAIMASIEQPLRSSRRLTNTIPRALDQAQRDHQQIYDRLRQRDADGAAQAMGDHLVWSEEQLLRRWRRRPATRSESRSPRTSTARRTNGRPGK